MRHLAVCGLLALLAVPGFALEPYLVQDINPFLKPADSDPSGLVRLGDAVLFFAAGSYRGRELWRSDGTAAGTWRLADFCDSDCFAHPQPFFATERLYFFLVASSLWASDGTAAGTLRLTGPDVFLNGASPRTIWAASQGALYFVAEDLEHGPELWRSDGTPAGTYLVADLRPGRRGADVDWMTEYRGRVWFGADDGQRGGALWSTDGTRAGTVLALDPLPASASHPAPALLRVLGNRLTFSALGQLWAGDGTPRRTAPVTALSGGKGASTLHDSVVRGNRLYFVAQDKKGQELWVSDGTARGTQVLTRFLRSDAFFSFQYEFALPLPVQPGLRDRFVFLAHDGPHGIEPWITDGTQKGTRLLRDVCPGACSGARELWTGLNGRLYFAADDGALGDEPWSTDGTAGGTRPLDICPGGCSASPFAPFVLGSRLLFLARDGQTEYEFWSTDGTAAGTVRVSDFGAPFFADEFRGVAADGQLLFGARDGEHGAELWRTDGTAAGTQLVLDVNAADEGGSSPIALYSHGDGVFLLADDGVHGFELWHSHGPGPGAGLVRDLTPGEEPVFPWDVQAAVLGEDLLFASGYLHSGLWRTDGTEAGTRELSAPESQPCCLRAALGRAFFIADDGIHGQEPWTSDGTAAGTRMLADVNPGPQGSIPRNLIEFQGKLWFTAFGQDGPPGGLWTSDGTAAGTVLVKSLAGLSDDSLPTVHAGRLWFFLGDGELWASDGTEAGTARVANLALGPGFFRPTFLGSLGPLLLASGVGAAGGGLWVSDGTPEGTKKISSQATSPEFLSWWAVFQDRLFFASDHDELWVTDGTAAGTRPFQGPEGRMDAPRGFAVLGDRLLFIARDSLYQTDGTASGTLRIRERVSPPLVRAGDRVFFGAFDEATGTELWAVRP
jgi:ELWxxDGT repeat protein